MENNKDGILLETGTNEIEIMEFTIDGNLYGINVAKVREIMLSAPVHPMPHAHPAVEGIFKPRDIVITVVDLPEYLSGHTEPKGEKDLFGGGGGAGINITPIAFIAVSNGDVRVLPLVSSPDSNSQIVNLVPELVNKVSDLFKKKKEKTEVTTVEADKDSATVTVTQTES